MDIPININTFKEKKHDRLFPCQKCPATIKSDAYEAALIAIAEILSDLPKYKLR